MTSSTLSVAHFRVFISNSALDASERASSGLEAMTVVLLGILGGSHRSMSLLSLSRASVAGICLASRKLFIVKVVCVGC